MNKTTIIFALLCSTLITPIYAEEIKLSPELDAFMELKPLDPKRFEKNAYIGFIGKTYPRDNWQTIYKDIFIKNDALVLERTKQGGISKDYFTDPIKIVFQMKDQIGNTEVLTLHDPKKMVSLEDYLSKGELFLKFQQASYEEGKRPNSTDYFPCQTYMQPNCIETIIERKEYIQSIIQKNRTLLNRFLTLINNSERYDFIIHDGQDFMEAMIIGYQNIQRIYHLTLAQAIIEISEGQINEGFDKLMLARQWINLAYHDQSNIMLIDSRAFTNLTLSLDHTMNALLDSHLLDKHLNNPQLQSVLAPFTNNIGNKITQTVIWEHAHSFKQRYYPFIKIYKAPLNIPQLTIEDEFIIATYLEEQGYELPPKLKGLSENLALQTDPSWKKAEALITLLLKIEKASDSRINVAIDNMKAQVFENQSAPHSKGETKQLKQSYDDYLKELDQWYQAYFEQLGTTPTALISYLNTKYPSTEYFNTFYNALRILEKANKTNAVLTSEKIEALMIKGLSEKSWVIIKKDFGAEWIYNSWARAIEPQNYHQLVYLKYLILKDRITTDEIPEFLESQGNLAKNTVTKDPYHFDAKTGILSTPLPIEDKFLPISVREARNKDQSIQNFAVEIPKL